MKILHNIFSLFHLVISILFIVAAMGLISLAVSEIWHFLPFAEQVGPEQRLNNILESIALLTVAVAALELGQTILEEEVQRGAHMAAPTRVRRFLSRFLVALVVALSIESLVSVFRFSRDEPELLPYAASIGAGAALLLAAWGVFIHFNRSAEELEPEAMEEAKQEDEKIEK